MEKNAKLLTFPPAPISCKKLHSTFEIGPFKIARFIKNLQLDIKNQFLEIEITTSLLGKKYQSVHYFKEHI